MLVIIEQVKKGNIYIYIYLYSKEIRSCSTQKPRVHLVFPDFFCLSLMQLIDS